ncbi:hypothetical protein EVG20_g11015, partial [Dentipellis fragilis]
IDCGVFSAHEADKKHTQIQRDADALQILAPALALAGNVVQQGRACGRADRDAGTGAGSEKANREQPPFNFKEALHPRMEQRRAQSLEPEARTLCRSAPRPRPTPSYPRRRGNTTHGRGPRLSFALLVQSLPALPRPPARTCAFFASRQLTVLSRIRALTFNSSARTLWAANGKTSASVRCAIHGHGVPLSSASHTVPRPPSPPLSPMSARGSWLAAQSGVRSRVRSRVHGLVDLWTCGRAHSPPTQCLPNADVGARFPRAHLRGALKLGPPVDVDVDELLYSSCACRWALGFGLGQLQLGSSSRRRRHDGPWIGVPHAAQLLHHTYSNLQLQVALSPVEQDRSRAAGSTSTPIARARVHNARRARVVRLKTPSKVQMRAVHTPTSHARARTPFLAITSTTQHSSQLGTRAEPEWKTRAAIGVLTVATTMTCYTATSHNPRSLPWPMLMLISRSSRPRPRPGPYALTGIRLLDKLPVLTSPSPSPSPPSQRHRRIEQTRPAPVPICIPSRAIRNAADFDVCRTTTNVNITATSGHPGIHTSDPTYTHARRRALQLVTACTWLATVSAVSGLYRSLLTPGTLSVSLSLSLSLSISTSVTSDPQPPIQIAIPTRAHHDQVPPSPRPSSRSTFAISAPRRLKVKLRPASSSIASTGTIKPANAHARRSPSRPQSPSPMAHHPPPCPMFRFSIPGIPSSPCAGFRSAHIPPCSRACEPLDKATELSNRNRNGTGTGIPDIEYWRTGMLR